nr:unnamed protein product [Callosobruchus chinensis]
MEKNIWSSPELIFLNEADEEVERHLLGRLNRDECNKLLQSKGFKLKENARNFKEYICYC